MSNYSESEVSSDAGEEIVAPPAPAFQSLGSWSQFRCPELIVQEAFETHPFRIPKHISAATVKSLENVLLTFDDIYNGTGWRDNPCITPHDIFQYAKDTRVSAYMYAGRRLSKVETRENSHDLAIVFTVWNGLSYFYKSMGPRARDDWQHMRDKAAPDCQNNKHTKQTTHELAKSERHMPKPVEEFAPSRGIWI